MGHTHSLYSGFLLTHKVSIQVSLLMTLPEYQGLGITIAFSFFMFWKSSSETFDSSSESSLYFITGFCFLLSTWSFSSSFTHQSDWLTHKCCLWHVGSVMNLDLSLTYQDYILDWFQVFSLCSKSHQWYHIEWS